jgi:hypothetical protein
MEHQFNVDDDVWVKGKVSKVDDSNFPYNVKTPDGNSYWLSEDCLIPAPTTDEITADKPTLSKSDMESLNKRFPQIKLDRPYTQRQLLRLDVAKAAMQGILANLDGNIPCVGISKQLLEIEDFVWVRDGDSLVAKLSIIQADALLAEWERTNQND